MRFESPHSVTAAELPSRECWQGAVFAVHSPYPAGEKSARIPAMEEARDPFADVSPSRLEQAGQFARRLELQMAQGRWPAAAQTLAEARDALDGLTARRALGRNTTLAMVIDKVRRGDQRDDTLLRAINQLENRLDIITVGDLLAAGWARVARTPDVGPESVLALADAIVEFAFVAGDGDEHEAPRTARRAAG
jgi:hypothetical protein